MNKLHAISLILATALATPMHAQGTAEMSDAEVRKVDKDAAKITLKHGEIRNLDMPPMTMVFQVKDAALLDKFKPGDKVKFMAQKVGSAYVVTAIEAAQ
jgi:Cu(I)/Ag(I) efflux system periplasmic protein CusF